MPRCGHASSPSCSSSRARATSPRSRPRSTRWRKAALGDANLLEFSIRAARAGATVGEISLALEKAFGRHVASIHTISGVYRKEIGDNPAVDRVQDKVDAFEKKAGRKPRILVAKMGQDGHDRGQKVIATAFADLGFDVTVGAMFQTPDEIAKLAVDNDVDIVGASSLAAGHLTLVPELRDALKKLGRARYHDRRRRRHPAGRFYRGARGRRDGDLSAGHGHPGGGGAAAGAAADWLRAMPS